MKLINVFPGPGFVRPIDLLSIDEAKRRIVNIVREKLDRDIVVKFVETREHERLPRWRAPSSDADCDFRVETIVGSAGRTIAYSCSSTAMSARGLEWQHAYNRMYHAALAGLNLFTS